MLRCGILARMIQTTYAYFAETVLSTTPLVRRGALGLLLAAGALMIALLIGITGPLIALVLALAVVGGTLILVDTHWGYVALVGVVFVLPFASLPFRLGFKPTFLDAALGALVFVWALKLVAARPAFTLSPSAKNATPLQNRQFEISPIGLLIGAVHADGSIQLSSTACHTAGLPAPSSAALAKSFWASASISSSLTRFARRKK